MPMYRYTWLCTECSCPCGLISDLLNNMSEHPTACPFPLPQREFKANWRLEERELIEKEEINAK